MTWVLALLGLWFVARAVRLRRRVSALRVLPEAPTTAAPASGNFVWFTAPGLEVDARTRRDAETYAHLEGLEVLDLIPRDLPTRFALILPHFVDPRRYRNAQMSSGSTSFHAILASRDAVARSGAGAMRNDTAIDRLQLLFRLKRYCSKTTDLVVAPGLAAIDVDRGFRGQTMRVLIRNWMTRPVVLGLLIAGYVVAPAAAGAATLALHLQPLIVFARQPLRPRDLYRTLLLRTAQIFHEYLLLVVGGLRRQRQASPEELQRREEYRALLSGGTELFFDKDAERCPSCASNELVTHLTMGEYHQSKPGRFRLSRCRSCSHIFQNPTLSERGEAFYNKDLFDGLGAEAAETAGAATAAYNQLRARSVSGWCEPHRWLDAGAGRGYFACIARQIWPDALFEGLDPGSAAEEAEKRRWLDRGHRGRLSDLLPQRRGDFDVVSMFGYLERAAIPAAELAAARELLGLEGHLVVELPDASAPAARLLGRFWGGWFQPQTRHWYRREAVDELLRAHGFVPLVWQRREATRANDFSAAATILVRLLAPPPDLPWREPSGVFSRARYELRSWVAPPLLHAIFVINLALLPILWRPRFANAFRVVARRA
jgi:hypothetical protein